jgi:putative PIN family toxin of toxin-antitoxin system
VNVVLDTNVFVSGVFFAGVPGRIVSAWASGQITLVLSPDILAEYHRVGQEIGVAYPERAAAFEPFVALLAMTATIVDAPPLPERVGDDPDDEMFLAAALASDTPIVVSGDKGLLQVSGWRGIIVRTPRQFHDEYLASDS